MRRLIARAGGVIATALLARLRGEHEVGRAVRRERSAKRVRGLGAQAVAAVLVHLAALGEDLWSVSMSDDWDGSGNHRGAPGGIS